MVVSYVEKNGTCKIESVSECHAHYQRKHKTNTSGGQREAANGMLMKICDEVLQCYVTEVV